MPKNNNKPVAKIRAGKIQVSVWEEEKQDGDRKYIQSSVSIEKSYKDGQGNWKTTNNLFPNEIPQAIAALQRAYNGIVVTETND